MRKEHLKTIARRLSVINQLDKLYQHVSTVYTELTVTVNDQTVVNAHPSRLYLGFFQTAVAIGQGLYPLADKLVNLSQGIYLPSENYELFADKQYKLCTCEWRAKLSGITDLIVIESIYTG